MSPPVRTDDELLAAHRVGDRHAFGELAARYTDRLWAIAVRTLHHREDAADAVQEALVAAYLAAASFRGEAAVSTWLTRILLNACVDRIRKQRARAEVTALHRVTGTGHRDLATDLATRLSVREALTLLPIGQRMAVVLVDVHGLSVAETAELLQVPVGTVKSRCARGRARLAGLLGHLRTEEAE